MLPSPSQAEADNLHPMFRDSRTLGYIRAATENLDRILTIEKLRLLRTGDTNIRCA